MAALTFALVLSLSETPNPGSPTPRPGTADSPPTHAESSPLAPVPKDHLLLHSPQKPTEHDLTLGVEYLDPARDADNYWDDDAVA